MEDFGYSKHQEQGSGNSILKKAFLLGATLFSLACFTYVTINAYYYIYSDKNNNIELIKAAADPIKVVEEEKHLNEMKIDNSIYEDIFGNKKHREKEIKLRESAETAIPPKVKDVEEIEKKPAKDIAKNNQIIVYSDKKPEENNRDFLNAKPVRTESQIKNIEEKESAASKPVLTLNKQKKLVKVQVAALTSRESANEYWKNLQNRHSSLLSSLRPFIEQVDLGKRGIFYRLQIGNFSDQIRAEEFCNRYVAQAKKNRADCIVVE